MYSSIHQSMPLYSQGISLPSMEYKLTILRHKKHRVTLLLVLFLIIPFDVQCMNGKESQLNLLKVPRGGEDRGGKKSKSRDSSPSPSLLGASGTSGASGLSGSKSNPSSPRSSSGSLLGSNSNLAASGASPRRSSWDIRGLFGRSGGKKSKAQQQGDLSGNVEYPLTGYLEGRRSSSSGQRNKGSIPKITLTRQVSVSTPQLSQQAPSTALGSASSSQSSLLLWLFPKKGSAASRSSTTSSTGSVNVDKVKMKELVKILRKKKPKLQDLQSLGLGSNSGTQWIRYIDKKGQIMFQPKRYMKSNRIDPVEGAEGLSLTQDQFSDMVSQVKRLKAARQAKEASSSVVGAQGGTSP